MNERIIGSITAAATRRSGTPRQPKSRLEVDLGSEHFFDAVKEEAAVRGMSISSFMRAMIRGYFAAALHGR